MASPVPATKIGRIGTSCAAARTAAPECNLPREPFRERVPSGYSRRFQRLLMRRCRWSAEPFSIPPPRREIGTVLKSRETIAATQRLR